MMRTALRSLLLLGAVTSTATSLWGQMFAPRREVDLALEYTAQRSNITPGDFFWRQGGAFQASAEFYRGFGIAVDAAGSHRSNILDTGIDLNTFTITAGPRYTWRDARGRVAVFGQGLVGDSHAWDSRFPQSGGAKTSADSLALLVGGGVELMLGKRFAIEPVEANWVRTQFPNATTDVQNDLRLGAGVVFRIPHF